MSRETAFDVLRSGSSTPMREVNRFADYHELDARDRGLARALVGCEVRRRATLRAIVGVFAKGNPSPEVATLLRLGAAQLLFLDTIPDHAAVSETVRVATDRISLPRGRYVNGVLRTLQRARRPGHCGDPRQDVVGADWHFTVPVFRDPEEHPTLWAEDALSLPANLYKRWHKRLGPEKARELGETALGEPELSILSFAETRDTTLQRWAELGGRAGKHPNISLFPADCVGTILESEEFTSGKVSIQGETALRAADAVGARPGERILDVCAAPGGKTAWLAQSGAQVFATDISEGRLEQLDGTVTRLNVQDNVQLLVSDGTQAIAPDMERFDAALLDAPCSNTGVLAGRPGARWRFGPQSQKELVTLQGRLLEETAAWVRPGGRLIYSTCSLETDENMQLVRRFLDANPDWSLHHSESWMPEPRGGEGPIDGGFHARLLRSNDE